MSDKQTLLQRILLVLIFGAYCAEMYFIFASTPSPCEDAYITFRFSRNLAEGVGPVFNAGDHVEGYSNFLWMTAIAVGHILGFDMTAFSRIAGLLCNTLSLVLVWYIPHRFFSIRGFSGFLAPILFMLFLPFHFFAASGLETSLYTLLILLCLTTLLCARTRPLPLGLAGLLFLLIALTRPEGVLFFLFYCAYLLGNFVFRHESVKPYLPGILLCSAGGIAFLLWRMSYYGAPLPNTYYAKGSFPFFIRLLFGFLINKGFITHYPYLLFLVPACLCIRLQTARRLIEPVVVLLAAGMCFSIGFSGFDWMPFFRYTVPVVPLMIICSQIFFSKLWATLSESARTGQKLLWAGMLLLTLLFAVEQFWQDVAFNLRWGDITLYGRHNQKMIGDWIKKELGRKPAIAMGDVGYLAFVSDARILDIFGLISKEFADIKNRYGAPDIDIKRGKVGFDTYKQRERELLLKLAPDYVLLYNARLKISDTYPGSTAGIVEHEDFRAAYDYMTTFYIIPRFESPAWPKLHHCIDILDLSAGLLSWTQDGWGYDIYIRKDSPYKRFFLKTSSDERITQVVETE